MADGSLQTTVLCVLCLVYLGVSQGTPISPETGDADPAKEAASILKEKLEEKYEGLQKDSPAVRRIVNVFKEKKQPLSGFSKWLDLSSYCFFFCFFLFFF